MVIDDEIQDTVQILATVWHRPGTLSKKCSPSSLPEIKKQNTPDNLRLVIAYIHRGMHSELLKAKGSYGTSIWCTMTYNHEKRRHESSLFLYS